MRIGLLILSLVFWSLANASQTIPAVTVQENVVGGTILLLQMKYSLVISAADEKQLVSELGAERKKDFYTAMIMNAAPTDLRKSFDSKTHALTEKIITQYEMTAKVIKPMALN